MSDIHVTGLADLQKFLDTLPAKLEANIVRGALRAGANVIRSAAKQNVRVSRPGHKDQFDPYYAGVLRDSIKVGTKIDRQKGVVMATIKAGGMFRGMNIFWAKFVEFGTRAHLISVPYLERNINARLSRKRGEIVRESMTTVNRRVLQIGNTFVGPTVSHPGAKPHPFMRPALDSQAQNAVIAAAEYMKKRLSEKSGIDTSYVMIEGDE